MPRTVKVISSLAGSYPAADTASTTSRGAASPSSTVARPVARFTSTRRTPGTARIASSTRDTQEAQLMPPTSRSNVSRLESRSASANTFVFMTGV
jgi:hypothetical protein